MMEDNSANGLKRERRKRKRVALIRKAIISLITIWIFLSMGICTALLYKVHSLEYNLDYLLKNFTVSRQIEAESKQSGAAADESAYFDLEGAAEEYDDDYSIAQAVNQQENLAGPQDAHKVYLTFDDGPSSNTDRILDILAEYDVKATFFVVGKEEEEYQALYKRIVEEGHTLAMHSYSHKYDEIYQSVDSYAQDLRKLQEFLYDTTGVWCRFCRFPGGSSNTVSMVDMYDLIDYLDEQDITYFDWNVSSGDASNSYISPEMILRNCMATLPQYQESIILMHDASNKNTTVQALPDLIEQIQAMDDTVIVPLTEDTEPIQHISNERNGGL